MRIRRASLALLVTVCPTHAWITSKAVATTSLHVTSDQSLAASTGEDFSWDKDGMANLIDDGHGHINRELATSIWDWDDKQRNKLSRPKFQYSTRAGLRLVDQIARELLASLEDNTRSTPERGHYSAAMTYSDLVQEGVVALMYAMASYQDQGGGPSSFEAYARKAIGDRMTRSLARDSRPIRLPKHVQSILQQAKRTRLQLLSETGKEPSLQDVAEQLNVPPEKLELYQLVSGGTVSVERTVEIYDPFLEEKAMFADQETWESKHGNADEDFLNYNTLEDGEDEMWVHHEQIAAPLREMIQDFAPSPDDLVLQSMIRRDVESFLESTLTDRESQVIRMRYGLDSASGNSMSLSTIGNAMGLTEAHVEQIEAVAMDKLRTSYSNRNVEPYLDDNSQSG